MTFDLEISGRRVLVTAVTTPEGCARVAQGTLDHLGGIDIMSTSLAARSRGPAGSPLLTIPSGARRSIST